MWWPKILPRDNLRLLYNHLGLVYAWTTYDKPRGT